MILALQSMPLAIGFLCLFSTLPVLASTCALQVAEDFSGEKARFCSFSSGSGLSRQFVPGWMLGD